MFVNLARYRHYILRNAWLQLRRRYAGSGLGALWNVLTPLAEIAIYATVFARMLGVRSPGRADNPYAFVLYLTSGIFAWRAFTATVSGGSNAILSNARYLKQLAIPEEIFIAQNTASEAIILMIYLVFLVILGPLMRQPPGWADLLLPLVGILFLLLAFGLALLLAPLRVFFQDIGQVLGIVLQMWFWLSPVIWYDSVLSPQVLAVLRWNPTFIYLTSFRALYLENRVPLWDAWLLMLAWSAGTVLLGYTVLRRLRPEMRDVL